jgi:MoaA/NifB/PqqE/SkfB family radical SAM enzyme
VFVHQHTLIQHGNDQSNLPRHCTHFLSEHSFHHKEVVKAKIHDSHYNNNDSLSYYANLHGVFLIMSMKRMISESGNLAKFAAKEALGPVQHQLFGTEAPLGATPTNVVFEIVDRCMLRCSFCDYWKHTGEGELDISEWFRFLDQIHGWLGSSFRLSVTGGEPFMKKGIWEFLEHCANLQIPTVLLTNAYSVSEKHLRRLANIRLTQVSISVDGLPDQHNAVRGLKNAFERTWASIQFLLAQPRSFLVATSTVISQQNIKDLGKIAEFLASGGVERIFFQPIQGVPQNAGRADYPTFPYNSPLWPTSEGEINDAIDQLLDAKKKGVPIAHSKNELESYRQYFLKAQDWVRPWACNLVFSSFYVNAYGDVRLCIPDSRAVGNLTEGTPQEIWNSARTNDSRAWMSKCTAPCLLNCTRKYTIGERVQYASNLISQRLNS